MALLDDRRTQMFPVLSTAQMEVAKRFAAGEPRRFLKGEVLFQTGQRDAVSWLVLEGSIEVVRRDGRGYEEPLITEAAGMISGEVSQLAGGPALATGRAGPNGCFAAPFDAPHLRALVIGSADVGELVMRAFILRRVALLEAGNTGSVLVGASGSRDLMRLQSFLSRNGYPLTVLNAEATGEGRDLLERMGVRDDELPLMLCPDGTVLKRPTERQAAACLGITPDLHADMLYDVAVVGAGPAGLATAVYAASEGLKVIVLEKAAFGGQAGASARIENYLGFPTGISGRALAGRAFNQALKFGAEVAVPLQVARLDCEGSANPDGRLRLELDGEAAPLHAKTIVIASGALYRRPAIANLEQFEGSGVSYWASPLEAKLCEGEEVALVGAGNSAGQAVVFLASKVKRLHMIVRGEGLAASMSAYLIDRISALPNVEIHTLTECTGLEGEPNGVLKRVRFTRHDTGETTVRDLHHLFLFIGADPNTAWVKDCVELDHHGFIRTGEAVHGAGERPVVRSLETSRRRVFAVGDVRSASTKRVGAAIGEGAAVVAQIHAALAEG